VSRRRSHVGVQIGIANLGHHRGIETGCLPHIKRWLKSIMWAQGKRDIIVVKWLLTLGISVERIGLVFVVPFQNSWTPLLDEQTGLQAVLFSVLSGEVMHIPKTFVEISEPCFCVLRCCLSIECLG